MILRVSGVLALVAMAALASSVPVPAQDAPAPSADARRDLKFHRPQVKGSRFRFTTKVSQTRTVDVHADEEINPGGSESLEMALEGVLEITEVTPKFGLIAGVSVTVEKMSLTDDKGHDDGFEPGTVISAEAQGDTVIYRARGGEVEGHIRDALEVALPRVYSVDEPMDDFLKPAGPVAPGDSWEADISKLAELLKKVRGQEINPARSKATVLYQGATTTGGLPTDTVVLSTSLEYKEADSLPESYRLISSNTVHDSTTAMPTDPASAYIPSERTVTESKTRVAGKQEDQEFELEIKSHLVVKRTLAPTE